VKDVSAFTTPYQVLCTRVVSAVDDCTDGQTQGHPELVTGRAAATCNNAHGTIKRLARNFIATNGHNRAQFPTELGIDRQNAQHKKASTPEQHCEWIPCGQDGRRTRHKMLF